MDEITSSNTIGWSNDIQFPMTSTCSDYGNALSFTVNTTWSFFNNFYEWPKGVRDPSTELKYVPKWHRLIGYKYQIKHMWD